MLMITSWLNAPAIIQIVDVQKIPYFEDDDMEDSQRFARVGKETFYVPANMTFKEFQDKYIKKSVPM